MKSTVVPFRNGIMLAIATGIAESHELKRVYFFNDTATTEIYTVVDTLSLHDALQ